MKLMRLPCAVLALVSQAVGAAAQQPAVDESDRDRVSVVSLAEVVGPGVVSTGGFELGPALDRDGRTLYFVKSAPGFLRDADFTIVVSESDANGAWTTPRVAPFSGRHSDLNPSFAPDGQRLFFASNRPLSGSESGSFNLWVVAREAGGWGEPQPLPPPINSAANELWASETDEGTLYFDSDRGGENSGWDLYRVRKRAGEYQHAEQLWDLNSARLDINPTVAHDESWILFSSWDRAARGTKGDLYLSRRQGEDWGEPQALEIINSSADDFHPMLSPDGRYLYFVSDRRLQPSRPERDYAGLVRRLEGPGNGLGDIYRILVRHLGVRLP